MSREAASTPRSPRTFCWTTEICLCFIHSRDGMGTARDDLITAPSRSPCTPHSWRARYDLGVLYQNGSGVQKSCRKAEKWFRMAANQGHPAAQFNLGCL